MMKNYKNTYQNTLIASGKSIEGEVVSAFILKLIKQTKKNIELARQDRKIKKCGYIVSMQHLNNSVIFKLHSRTLHRKGVV